ncbi:MAG: hypothetical protein KC441_11620 [Anaerolineales bacterium]|nr:hypothetical protein [Anaerolineales bacterium]
MLDSESKLNRGDINDKATTGMMKAKHANDLKRSFSSSQVFFEKTLEIMAH